MNYEPQIIFNPNNKEVEVMYDRKITKFAPGEKKHLDGGLAYFAVNNFKGGLKVYEPDGDDDKAQFSSIAYDKMPWREIVSLASAKGFFKPGMGRKEAVKLLAESDGQGAL